MNIGDTVGKLDGLRANLATTTGNLANISGGTYNNIRDFNNFAIIMDSKAVNTRTLDGYYIPMLAALVAYLNVNNNKETVVIAKQVVTEMLAHL